MKRFILLLLCATLIAGCATPEPKGEATAPAQVGIVNHTDRYIYSASVDGAWGGNMPAWGAGGAGVCCASIPRFWRPGLKVRVIWDMPEGKKHIVKEKIVEIEKYDEPGSIYMHFFPNDEVRVVVANSAGWGKNHPIAPPVDPNKTPIQK